MHNALINIALLSFAAGMWAGCGLFVIIHQIVRRAYRGQPANVGDVVTPKRANRAKARESFDWSKQLSLF